MKPNTLLVIDDEVCIRDLLRDFLSIANIPCRTAAGAEEAYRLLANEPFALVLLDHFLGGDLIEDVTRRIHDLQPGVPIVMLSGAARIGRERLDDLGVADFVAKPFAFDTLMTMVNRYMEIE